MCKFCICALVGIIIEWFLNIYVFICLKFTGLRKQTSTIVGFQFTLSSLPVDVFCQQDQPTTRVFHKAMNFIASWSEFINCFVLHTAYRNNTAVYQKQVFQTCVKVLRGVMNVVLHQHVTYIECEYMPVTADRGSTRGVVWWNKV